MSSILYLAEPIDLAERDIDRRPTNLAQNLAASTGWVVFRPRSAWMVQPGLAPSPELDRANRTILERAGAVVAYLPDGVTTLGVPREIEFARAREIPVLLLRREHDGPNRSWAVADLPEARTEEQILKFLYDASRAIPVTAMAMHRPVSAQIEQIQTVTSAPDGEFISASMERVVSAPILFHVEQDDLDPIRNYRGDAGYDLLCAENIQVPPHTFRDIRTGVRVALPPGVWLRICGRSSTIRNRSLMVTEGVIDTGFRGELKVGVWNLGSRTQQIRRGDRLAQAIPMPNLATYLLREHLSSQEFEELEQFDGRGEQGFGSTS